MSTDQSSYGFSQSPSTPAETTPAETTSTVMGQSVSRPRGRPRVAVSWPDERFTFNALTQANGKLSTSSLRKKMRTELMKGGLVKVGTLKTAFGRPQDLYKKP